MKVVRALYRVRFWGWAVFFIPAVVFCLQAMRYIFSGLDERNLPLPIIISVGGMVLGIGIIIIFSRAFDDSLVARLLKIKKRKEQARTRRNL